MRKLLQQILPVCACLFALTGHTMVKSQAISAVPIAGSLSDAERVYDEGDFAKAAELYQVLAERGNAAAQTQLGFLYEYGKGVPQDFKEAAKWYKPAAEQSNAIAQYNLAGLYANGKIGHKDLKAALSWFEKAASAGLKYAQVSLGWAYMSNYLGLAPDYQLAMKWNLKAADQWFGRGSENIGLLYEKGWGVPVNYLEAANWYKKAIDQDADSGQAQFQLGELYEHGLGVQKNLSEAANLYQIVVEKYGDSEYAYEAQARLDSIQNQQQHE